MPIDLTSRYQRNDTALVSDRKGRLQKAILHRSPVNQDLRVVDYLWRDQSRVDITAASYFGNELPWHIFAEANPRVLDWTQVTPGTQVMVPRAVS